MTSKTHWKSTKESHRKVKQTKNWVGKRESQRRRNAQIGDGMGLWWLKLATEYSNRRRLGLFWLIDDGMLIGDGWLGLLVMECTSVTVGLGYRWRKAHIGGKMLKSMMVGFLLAYQRWNAHRRRLLGLLATGCSSMTVGLGYWRWNAHQRRLVFWVIGFKWRWRRRGSVWCSDSWEWNEIRGRREVKVYL